MVAPRSPPTYLGPYVNEQKVTAARRRGEPTPTRMRGATHTRALRISRRITDGAQRAPPFKLGARNGWHSFTDHHPSAAVGPSGPRVDTSPRTSPRSATKAQKLPSAPSTNHNDPIEFRISNVSLPRLEILGEKKHQPKFFHVFLPSFVFDMRKKLKFVDDFFPREIL